MRVQCPHCQKTVSLDNAKAEQPTTCPDCGDVFQAPALLNALPDEPVSTAPPTPPVAAPSPVAPARAEPRAAASAANDPCCSLVIPKQVMHWIGPGSLAVLFLLSFFSWIEASPGGLPVYTQSPWGIMAGSFSTDITGEEVFGLEAELKAGSRFSFTMFLFLLMLVPAVILGLGELAEPYINVPVPDLLNMIWPNRLAILSAMTLLMFVLFLWQVLGTVGLEGAMGRRADAKCPVAAEETPKQKYVRELKRGEEYSRLGVRRTAWFWWSFAAMTLAAASFASELALARRGYKSDPRIELYW